MNPTGPRLANDSVVELACVNIQIPFYNGSGSTIAKGDWVVLDRAVTTYGLGNSVKQSGATADLPEVVGVAAEAIPDLKWGKIVVYGVTDDDTAIADAVAAGGALQTIATAGRAGAAGADTERIIGTALEDGDANNTGRVFVKCMGS